jgi:purine-nucleoside phosphorylase
MTAVYSAQLREIAHAAAHSLGFMLKSGVYAAVPGPQYETPAEVRMLRTLGADVVGMSTVPEAIAAKHAGIEILAFAVVTNPAAGLVDQPLDHADVLEKGRNAVPLLGQLIEQVLSRLP